MRRPYYKRHLYRRAAALALLSGFVCLVFTAYMVDLESAIGISLAVTLLSFLLGIAD